MSLSASESIERKLSDDAIQSRIGKRLPRDPRDYLTRLPEELLLKIFEMIRTETNDHNAKRTYYALGLTCFTCSRVALPFLYSIFHFETYHRATQYMQTIEKRPKYANAIKHVELNSPTAFHGSGELHERSLAMKAQRFDYEAIIESLNYLQIPGKESWIEEVDDGLDGHTYLVLGLIICHTPNIETLHLVADHGRSFQSDRFLNYRSTLR